MSDYGELELAPGVKVSECYTCWALVDIDRERLHTQWHESQKPRLP